MNSDTGLSFILKHSILINKNREAVWDFTQDYSRRHLWDKSVWKAEETMEGNNRVARLAMKGKTTMTFVYKLDDRPNKTTLVAREIKSPLVTAAGGSWSYTENSGGTLWEQTNSITIRNTFFTRLLFSFIKKMFNARMKQSMNLAKKIIEADK